MKRNAKINTRRGRNNHQIFITMENSPPPGWLSLYKVLDVVTIREHIAEIRLAVKKDLFPRAVPRVFTKLRNKFGEQVCDKNLLCNATGRSLAVELSLAISVVENHRFFPACKFHRRPADEKFASRNFYNFPGRWWNVYTLRMTGDRENYKTWWGYKHDRVEIQISGEQRARESWKPHR